VWLALTLNPDFVGVRCVPSRSWRFKILLAKHETTHSPYSYSPYSNLHPLPPNTRQPKQNASAACKGDGGGG